MRKVSLNQRLSLDAPATDELEVVLVHITHPDLEKPIRLSTDPTERLSVEPLQYGTRSTWQTDDNSPFLFIMMSVLVPDDLEDTPAAAALVLEAVDNRIAEALRSTITQATVDIGVVLASDPDLVEFEVLGMKLAEASGDNNQFSLRVSRDLMVSESWPTGRMTRSRFPGLNP